MARLRLTPMLEPGDGSLLPDDIQHPGFQSAGLVGATTSFATKISPHSKVSPFHTPIHKSTLNSNSRVITFQEAGAIPNCHGSATAKYALVLREGRSRAIPLDGWILKKMRSPLPPASVHSLSPRLDREKLSWVVCVQSMGQGGTRSSLIFCSARYGLYNPRAERIIRIQFLKVCFRKIHRFQSSKTSQL